MEINPILPEAYYNLGIITETEDCSVKLYRIIRKDCVLNQTLFMHIITLGIIYRETGQVDKAEECFRHAIQIDPYSNAFGNLLFTMLCNARHNPQAIYFEHLNFSSNVQNILLLLYHLIQIIVMLIGNLNIGYVSPDFRRHPVTFFVEPVIMSHNREISRFFAIQTCQYQMHLQDACRIILIDGAI